MKHQGNVQPGETVALTKAHLRRITGNDPTSWLWRLRGVALKGHLGGLDSSRFVAVQWEGETTPQIVARCNVCSVKRHLVAMYDY